MDKIKIATWNVNSVRARFNAITEWLKTENPDIVLMQEIKCKDEVFPEEDFIDLGYNVLRKGQPSYNGVAIISKFPLNLELDALPSYGLDDEDTAARYIEAFFEIQGKVIRVASIYVPNGDSKLEKGEKLEESEKFQYKLNFFERLKRRFKEMSSFSDEIIVCGGDYNVAHTSYDLYNPEKAAGHVGFHPLEINKLDSLNNIGFKDLFRHFNKDAGHYSWWNYRYSGWLNNRGWRIDYLLTPNSDMFSSCVIDKEVRGYDKPSDHVPVIGYLNL